MRQLLGVTAAALLGAARAPQAPPLSLASLPLESILSFELGGVPSARLLGAWNRTTSTFPLAVDADGFATLSKTLPPLTAALFDVHVQ